MKFLRSSMILLAMVTLLLSGCATNMSQKEVYTLPEAPELKESELRVPYSYVVVPMNPILYLSGKYGVRHDMYSQEKGSKDNKLSSENFIGFRAMKDGMPVTIVLDYERKIDFGRKAYIGSRDNGGRYHQYSLDGKEVYGAYEKKFSWSELKPINETPGVEIYEDVQPGSDEDEFVVNSIARLAEKIEKLEIPGEFEKLLKRALSISSNELFVGVGADLSTGNVIGIVGARILPLIMRVLGISDPQGAHLEKALVTNYDLAKLYAEEIVPLRKALMGRDTAYAEDYLKTLGDYRRTLKNHNAVLGRQKAIQDAYLEKQKGTQP